LSAVTGTEPSTGSPRTEVPFSVRLGAFVELGKIRLSSLAIFAVVAGVYLGAGYGPYMSTGPDAALLLGAGIGSMLTAMAGNALNMYLERDLDRLMERTRARPLPSGRLQPRDVIGFGVVCAAVGLALMALFTNILAFALTLAIFVLYVGVYTPMKRITALNTVVGAVPGALPPVVGYAASAGQLDVNALALFLILFLWQVPHFLAISLRYAEDYRRGGLKMIAWMDTHGGSVRRLMLSHTLALIPVSMVPYLTRMSGEAYAASAVLLGIVFLVPVFCAAVLRWESAIRSTFVTSIVYLPLLFGIMVLDRA
jgi:protoheme IX farnesyltransferase